MHLLSFSSEPHAHDVQLLCQILSRPKLVNCWLVAQQIPILQKAQISFSGIRIRVCVAVVVVLCLSVCTLLGLQLRFPQKVLQMNTVRLPALFTPSQQQSLLLLHSRPLQIRCSSQNGKNLLQSLIPQGRLCQACLIGLHAACVVLFEHPILYQHHLTCYCILQLHLVAMMILKNHVTVSSVEHLVFTIQSQKTTRNFYIHTVHDLNG